MVRQTICYCHTIRSDDKVVALISPDGKYTLLIGVDDKVLFYAGGLFRDDGIPRISRLLSIPARTRAGRRIVWREAFLERIVVSDER